MGLEQGHLHCGRVVTVFVRAPSFLHHMVRNMVGALYEVGRGRVAPHVISEVISARDRSVAPTMAPPHGLYLCDVQYYSEGEEEELGLH